MFVACECLVGSVSALTSAAAALARKIDSPIFHRALVKRKYRLLYSPSKRRRPGPKGPSRELIDTVVEMKRRNPRIGCRKIAEQISNAFGLEIDKDVVRRILIHHYRPLPGGDGPSWLTVIGHARDSLWSVDLFRCE